MKEISLRPYTGKLFYVRTKKEYEQAHIDLFKEPDILSCSSNGGRFSGGCGKDNYWTYLIWAKSTAFLAHELVHVLVHVFERFGLNKRFWRRSICLYASNSYARYSIS